MGKVEENKRIKRVAILDAALQLFTDKGWSNTSISDIAARSGVAKGTFYLYFKDKYDIRNKLVVYQSRRLLKAAYEDMLAAGIKELSQQLIFIADHVLDRLQQRKDLLILISKNLSWGILKQELSRTEPEEGEADFIRDFHALTESQNIRPLDSEILLYLLSELIGSACYSAILYSEPCSLEALKPHLFEAVRRIVEQFIERAAEEAQA